MDARAATLSLLEFTRAMSNRILQDWPQDKYAFQNSPHDNHPLWVVGHIACTDVWFSTLVGVNLKIDEALAKKFGGGSKPSANAKDYPSFPELHRMFEQNRAAMVEWFKAAPESLLASDISAQTGGFATSPLDAMLKCAWHEGWHFGQVATIRRSLGLPNVMG